MKSHPDGHKGMGSCCRTLYLTEPNQPHYFIVVLHQTNPVNSVNQVYTERLRSICPTHDNLSQIVD